MTPLNYPPIKRVIDGVSYNTETSTLLKSRNTRDDPARSTPYGPAPVPAVEQLFRNRSGKFFFVYRDLPVFDSASRTYIPRDDIHPAPHEAAVSWLKNHFPNDQDTFLLTLPFAPPQAKPQAEATLSLRLDPYWKARLQQEAESHRTSANALAVSYLRHGLNHSVGHPVIPTDKFTTEDGRKLLTANGKRGLDGVEDAGSNHELDRAYVAQQFWAEGKAIPESIRQVLESVLSMKGAEREVLLNDIKRWVELYGRPRANLDDALLTNFVSQIYKQTN